MDQNCLGALLIGDQHSFKLLFLRKASRQIVFLRLGLQEWVNNFYWRVSRFLWFVWCVFFNTGMSNFNNLNSVIKF